MLSYDVMLCSLRPAIVFYRKKIEGVQIKAEGSSLTWTRNSYFSCAVQPSSWRRSSKQALEWKNYILSGLLKSARRRFVLSLVPFTVTALFGAIYWHCIVWCHLLSLYCLMPFTGTILFGVIYWHCIV